MRRSIRFGILSFMLLVSPVVLQADLILNGAGGGQDVAARHGSGNSSLASSSVSSFPASGTLATDSVSAPSSASITYDYTQSQGNTTISWNSSIFQDGAFISYASAGGGADFAVTGSNEEFTWTANVTNEGSIGGKAGGYALLRDLTTNQNVFYDTTLGGGIFHDHTGTLLAGHDYELSQYIEIDWPLFPDTSSSSGTGDFRFATSVPEPASLTLAGMGAACLAVSAIRRRRQKTVALKSSFAN